MEAILVTLIVSVLNGAIAYIDQMLSGLASLTLHADQYMTVGGGGSMVGTLSDILLGFGVSLVILKFLKKGFECYVLWTDGDPDNEPIALVIRFVQAVAIALCFPTLYGWLADITGNLTDELLAAIGVSTNYNWKAWTKGISSMGLVTAILGLVFVISYFMLYFQFLMRGLEILILRVGLPLACVGLLDNDKGVFKNIFWGTACIVLAIRTPRFLVEFMVPSGGGGGVVNNVYHSVRLVGMAKNLMK